MLQIVQAPVPALEAEADRLISWLRYGVSASQSNSNVSNLTGHGSQISNAKTANLNAGSGGGASFLATSWVSMNPDFQLVCFDHYLN